MLIYFKADDIDALLERAVANGGEVMYPKKYNGTYGFGAEFRNGEGNRIALWMDTHEKSLYTIRPYQRLW